ncbi:MAG: metal-sensing transcriptional repressor [Clostridia bacterium]|nr:metal-sensing transcriptional repressor [Clostridia bacterium]
MNTEITCPCHKTKHRTVEESRALQNRLARIEGQVRGVRGMVERDAYCVEILTQVAAISAALNAFNRELLAEHIRTCVATDLKEGKDEVVEELVETVRKMMK